MPGFWTDCSRRYHEVGNVEWPMSGCHSGTVPDESAVLVAIGFSEAFSVIKFSVIIDSVLLAHLREQPNHFHYGQVPCVCVWVLHPHGALGKT